MSQQVQELIDKIKSEGVETAKEEASQIKEDAQKEAQTIIDDAKQKADKIVSDARQETKKMKESTEMSLKQASRDMLLSLRKQIEDVLKRIVQQDVSESLKPEELAKLIENVIGKAMEEKMEIAEIEISLNKKDLENLKKSFVAKLQKKIKEPIHFKASDDIGKGFTISFDKGKSNFDFSDESLAAYVGNFVNAQVAQLVKESL